ncbi:S-adenosylmethionine transporter [Schizosaccharomyces octosporus yFS286]|uniref:S-adenosylmethionine transporter n=1 Tax=Schizosaccharomyces octosporus (strain yFS286) TaxID=483514 RepID=S9R442_SCHOY|nr:S-adenosylmethionine transporter [Schizosaccharomyces octosporus yFS286]EPX73095.1 S-adenosylmethionine transporter [Schizosaccharomyces octosporus yFS286]
MSFFEALGSGICAGLAVDLSLFPVDTLKTRLQAKGGFLANGGFQGVYRGLGSILVGSAPGASLFFTTYETMKTKLHHSGLALSEPVIHMTSGSMGEIAACLVRVPTEVIKQRAQASGGTLSSRNVLQTIWKSEQSLRSLYSGYGITIMREIPFTLIQFPLWEYLKKTWRTSNNREKNMAHEAALSGSLAGGIAAALTTPLDVIKTRIMLSQKRTSYVSTVKNIIQLEGGRALFSGIVPRVLWLSGGGAIFLGFYDTVFNLIHEKHVS